MSHNTFGHLFRVTTFGESHGPMIGGVVDGCPPGIRLDMDAIQSAMDRRRPGKSRHTTQRREPDTVRLVSGVLETEDGLLTTGTPIGIIIENVDQRSKDYSKIADRYRPGHADYTYDVKYGLRDYRGGGRSSARETAVRVAAGAIARAVVPGVTIRGALVEMGGDKAHARDWSIIDDNDFFCPDEAAALRWESRLDEVRRAGSSVGAVVEIEASGAPAGWGAPIYGKLDQDLASAMMSINAVKGVEIGLGFEAARLSGEENADEMRMGPNGPEFLTNNAGGVLGGISTGAPVVVRFAVKPTSSIRTARRSVTRGGEEVDVSTTGRHDPCVGIRAVPVGEAMMAIVLADHHLRDRAQTGERS
ncbi:chorismate synthase [Acuticoccus sp. M5D2P5]|uniref:chorismate synthase n=1 Tax=Acuticoccus kalidii TaxID=2910977 RepID=UPI001F15E3C4|nr:chorismate synthase [Acuticoccus kalidii]MCF3936102.1 chorismate synthase [Acuticoccus kalidii]